MEEDSWKEQLGRVRIGQNINLYTTDMEADKECNRTEGIKSREGGEGRGGEKSWKRPTRRKRREEELEKVKSWSHGVSRGGSGG